MNQVMGTHRRRRVRLTVKHSLLCVTQVYEGADGLRGGVSQEGVHDYLAKPGDYSLALISVGWGQDVTDLPQEFSHSALQKTGKCASAPETVYTNASMHVAVSL